MIKLIKKVVSNVAAAVKDVYTKTAQTATNVACAVALVPKAVSTAISVTADTVSIALVESKPANFVVRAIRDIAVVLVWVANVVVQVTIAVSLIIGADTIVNIATELLVQHTPVVALAISGGAMCVLSMFAVYVAVKVCVFVSAAKFAAASSSGLAKGAVCCENAGSVVSSWVKWLNNKSINFSTFLSKLFDRVCDAVVDTLFNIGIRVGTVVLNRAARRQGVELV